MRARILSDAPIPVNSAPGTASDLPVPAGIGSSDPLDTAPYVPFLLHTPAAHLRHAHRDGQRARSAPGRPNEDYASVAVPSAGTGGALVVLDGVTPPRSDVGCAHGVPWFTARLGGALLELAASRRDLTLTECLVGSHFSYRRGTCFNL